MTQAFTPSRTEQEQLQALAKTLAQAGESVELLFGSGTQAQRIKLTPLLARLLQASVAELGAGHTLALVATEETVTPARAARLLGVSRPHLVNTLLRTGQLPFRMVGKHHRIAMNDLLAYQQERDQRRAAADALSQLSEDLDLYEQDQAPR
ncbi:helix-turn-helix domain-containing protein [Deinococcus aquatilis]|uniref:helix-turn-helix domain-containing protein n=1 Tax=Deinococcus aquatilis TaxID=519440 RepID=UPI00036B77B7|nr:helix-turn-helix domain-containing protein [Deinococcus aquatilis]